MHSAGELVHTAPRTRLEGQLHGRKASKLFLGKYFCVYVSLQQRALEAVGGREAGNKGERRKRGGGRGDKEWKDLDESYPFDPSEGHSVTSRSTDTSKQIAPYTETGTQACMHLYIQLYACNLSGRTGRERQRKPTHAENIKHTRVPTDQVQRCSVGDESGRTSFLEIVMDRKRQRERRLVL